MSHAMRHLSVVAYHWAEWTELWAKPSYVAHVTHNAFKGSFNYVLEALQDMGIIWSFFMFTTINDIVLRNGVKGATLGGIETTLSRFLK